MTLLSFVQLYPHASIILFGVLISLLITIVNYFVLDKSRMKELKARQKEIQKEMKEYKDNPNKMMELQKEMLKHTGETMKHSFKPMIITFIPIIIIFGFARTLFVETSIASTWIWWYIGASIVSSIAFRKLFDMP